MGSTSDTLHRVESAVSRHVRNSKGFEEESMVNPFEPHNCVAAFAMSRLLSQGDHFDYCIAVAPEGHVYGYFFELAGAAVLSVHVDYPPRRCIALDDLGPIAGKRVLILEDDVASGTTLRLILSVLEEYHPQRIGLYLGRAKRNQTLENIDSRISETYLSEDYLDPAQLPRLQTDFEEYFNKLFLPPR